MATCDLTRRQVWKQIAGTLGGALVAARAMDVTVDPVLALISEEASIRDLACAYQLRADEAVEALSDAEYEKVCRVPDEKLPAPIGPLYVEADRHLNTAKRLFAEIGRTRPKTINGVVALLELADHDDDPLVRNAIAGLRDIAARAAA